MVRVKTPSAIFQLNVAQEGASEKVRMEFDHDQLFAFYNRLNTIQQQLDDLS
jgi:COMM domain containing 10